MDKLLNFIEAEARANMAFHIANGEAIAKEANSFLNLLLAAGSGLIAFMVTLSQAKSGLALWQAAGMAAGAGYFFLIAGLLLRKCLWVAEIWPPANEPKNFPLTGYTVEELRTFELENRQGCIDRNRARNQRVGTWLNRCRALAAAMPVIASAMAYWASTAVVA